MRIHSHYRRTIQDLPIGEDTVLIDLIARKWFCDTPECTTKIFTERFDWLLPYSRRTERLTTVLRKLAFSTSCLSAEKVARAFHIQISHDTLLMILKNTEIPVQISEAIGLDDFAFKKGNDYGTLICDFRTHRPVAILPDRVTNIVKDWLVQQPQLQVVSRDGSNAFREAISKANPQIKQVLDWWHVIKNAHNYLFEWVKSTIPATIQWALPALISLDKRSNTPHQIQPEIDEKKWPHSTNSRRKRSW